MELNRSVSSSTLEADACSNSSSSSEVDRGTAKLHLLWRLVQDHLECPVCCQVPRDARVFQCENGHLICGICKPKMARCPQVRRV